MKAAAVMENIGIPIDVATLATLQANWSAMQERLIARVDSAFEVFEESTFKQERFEAYLARNGIHWPLLPSGKLAMDDKTFEMMSKAHPEVTPLREVRDLRSKMRGIELAVGSDGRNRCLLSAFRSKTGRNQPSGNKFIFGYPSWLRSVIAPEPAQGLAYIDWSQQEFGIAAALSRDPVMTKAYQSGDPYLAFAKQAGAAPPDATKKSHSDVRDQFKACALAVLYGMEAKSLAIRTGLSVLEAQALLRLHRQTYPQFWKWSDAAVDYANLYGGLNTVFGWAISVGSGSNPRMLRNFPMQANGAEMLRLACCLMTEAGIRVCAPVHDAVLIEAPVGEMEEIVGRAQHFMAEASALVLGGFRLRSDAKLVRHPDRYRDDRGRSMWDLVQELLEELGSVGTCAPLQPTDGQDRTPHVHASPPVQSNLSI
jgi:hypothetical protein